MKATAVAPANIAFIKYWGKKNDALRLPLNSSISMNLSGSFTTTTVEFSPDYPRDQVSLLGGTFSDIEISRVVKNLDYIRSRAGIALFAHVLTQNTFPKGAGAAASASGFAALSMAACFAAGLQLSQKELSIVARIGSGSACRSIPDGFVYWEAGAKTDDSYAYSLHPPTYWDLRDALVVVDSSMKKVSTSRGMEDVQTSPKLPDRLRCVPERIQAILKAIDIKDFTRFGEITEEDCLDMHAVMRSQVPPLNYWNDSTVGITNAVRQWRNEGLSVYFTIDAGANVHVLYEGHDEKQVLEKIQNISGVQSVIINKPAIGAHLVPAHLF